MLRLRSLCSHHARLFSTATEVFGCGSNVVDVIFRTTSVEIGTKSYFDSNVSIPEASLVGGVTLNHLAWAQKFHVPTGLLALQGTDSHGKMIRDKLASMGVDHSHIWIDSNHQTSLSHIILDKNGERAIIMAPGSTSNITKNVIHQQFKKQLTQARIVTTEISQLPLDAVKELLSSASGLTMLDVDVPPSVAVTGTFEGGSAIKKNIYTILPLSVASQSFNLTFIEYYFFMDSFFFFLFVFFYCCSFIYNNKTIQFRC